VLIAQANDASIVKKKKKIKSNPKINNDLKKKKILTMTTNLDQTSENTTASHGNVISI